MQNVAPKSRSVTTKRFAAESTEGVGVKHLPRPSSVPKALGEETFLLNPERGQCSLSCVWLPVLSRRRLQGLSCSPPWFEIPGTTELRSLSSGGERRRLDGPESSDSGDTKAVTGGHEACGMRLWSHSAAPEAEAAPEVCHLPLPTALMLRE